MGDDGRDDEVGAGGPSPRLADRLPRADEVPGFVGGLRGALTTDVGTPTDLQRDLIDTVLGRFGGPSAPRLGDVEALEPDEVADRLPREPLRHLFVTTLATLELILHPIPVALTSRVDRYARALGESGRASLDVARHEAEDRMFLAYQDIQRNSWYQQETVRESLRGRVLELARSKLAYYGIGADPQMASRWRSLGDHADGTWGRGVYDFYRAHDFPFPGEPHGIYELGAMHDFVHVIADYPTSPDGEIDVFAFIAGTMEDPKGFMQFVFTLALFQNASVDRVGGLKVAIARSDTLSDPGALDRLADALWRASRCTADVMAGVDHFALADRRLDDLRAEWSIPPKGVEGPGALS